MKTNLISKIVIVTVFIAVVFSTYNVPAKAEIARIEIETEPIPLVQQIKHDTEIVFNEWEIKQEPETSEPLPEYETPRVVLTQEEIDLLALMVMSEVSYKSQETKEIVACTAINRLLDDKYEFKNCNDISKIIKYWYSTVSNYEPTPACYDAVYTAIYNEVVPADVFYYCEGFSCPWGYPYIEIKNSFFSSYTNHNE